MAETWRTVPGWPAYSVSDLGRVQGPSGKVLRPGLVRSRHLGRASDRPVFAIVSLSTGGVRTSRKVHHLVLEAFVGPRPPGMECRHENGDPLDNRLDNLCWGTKTENVDDWYRHDTPGTKLSAEDVMEIRNYWAARKTNRLRQRELAEMYGVSTSHISVVANGKCWSRL